MAAVTINSLTHDGLADLAVKSTQEYQSAQTNEMEKLNEIDTMVKETLKNIEDSTTTPKPDTPISPPKPLTTEELLALIPDSIGTSIDYAMPTGKVYNTEDGDWTETKNNSIDFPEYSGASFQVFSSDDSDMKCDWKIWNIDSNNIYLISDKATTKTLSLQNCQGYNNGVTLLDNICNTLYANSSTYSGMTGRNLKIEDITNTRVLKDLTSNNTKNTYDNYEKQPYQYNFEYPYIWAQNEQSKENAIANRSTAYPLTTQTTSLDVKPWNSLWLNTSMNQSSFKAIGSDNSSILFNLVMGTGLGNSSNKIYLLSSRCVYTNTSSACEFGLQTVRSSGVGRCGFYAYNTGSAGSGGGSSAVRPLVVVPLSSCLISQNNNRVIPHRT